MLSRSLWTITLKILVTFIKILSNEKSRNEGQPLSLSIPETRPQVAVMNRRCRFFRKERSEAVHTESKIKVNWGVRETYAKSTLQS